MLLEIRAFFSSDKIWTRNATDGKFTDFLEWLHRNTTGLCTTVVKSGTCSIYTVPQKISWEVFDLLRNAKLSNWSCCKSNTNNFRWDKWHGRCASSIRVKLKPNTIINIMHTLCKKCNDDIMLLTQRLYLYRSCLFRREKPSYIMIASLINNALVLLFTHLNCLWMRNTNFCELFHNRFVSRYSNTLLLQIPLENKPTLNQPTNVWSS